MGLPSRRLVLTGLLALCDSPFPRLRIPKYSEEKFGPWELIFDGTERIVRGYFGGFRTMKENWVLKRTVRGKQTIWMSITPMETESQSHHAHVAKGNVYIAGGGMGVLAWNCAIKPEVERITLVERDPKIIELLNHLSFKHQWSHWDKVNIVQGDALETGFAERFDVALVDIWPGVGQACLRKDMQRIVQIVKADAYAAWGGELDFISWCMEQKGLTAGGITEAHWRKYSDGIGIPLILRDHPQMADFAMQAALQAISEQQQLSL